MKVLHTTSSKSEADALVGYLSEVSIDAAVVGHFDAIFRMWSQFDVMLRTESDLERAESAVKEFMASPAAMTEDLEDRSVADLALLDPALAPPCPACEAVLPLDGGLEHCPACGVEVDVGALVVAQHGPEVLATPGLRAGCAHCGYPAQGGPSTGVRTRTCPGCGRPMGTW